MTGLRYKAKIIYDGTHFSGYQIQPDERTVQGDLEKVLTKIAKGENVRVHGAGRTDAGVHARGQIIHFDFPFEIDPVGLMTGMNSGTTSEITILDMERVEDSFHARYLAKGKKYTYRVDNNRFRDPFLRHYSHHHRYPMTIEKVEQALNQLVGRHDFTSFASTHSDKEDKVRTIYQASVKMDEDTNEWVFTFVGNGFLYNMIRILMGTLLQVADGRREPEEIKAIIAAKDREAAGPTLSPSGLCMETVYYDTEEIPGYNKEG
ncbi:tRNA pseudouridine38-40 synthase [Alkalibacterium putridalgicola]|uniref:tRNA pseudouridine synthase A n=1 Tax=Alkalibacterium putridalgicola TaxID=426703 RepID=A0A1H7VGE6_9LACT|nr:tRNA pseudouridine(38-40) synthase TruA [Alkalibacterium putridalgicola]GEK89812.1 tRNA pseudouridine synthase A [Alkalibacterium putridalgicola]SEM08316.1 tRNA pseudouridine38-40 synthase [Alkalibacterium putridalgicola]